MVGGGSFAGCICFQVLLEKTRVENQRVARRKGKRIKSEVVSSCSKTDVIHNALVLVINLIALHAVLHVYKSLYYVK